MLISLASLSAAFLLSTNNNYPVQTVQAAQTSEQVKDAHPLAKLNWTVKTDEGEYESEALFTFYNSDYNGGKGIRYESLTPDLPKGFVVDKNSFKGKYLRDGNETYIKGIASAVIKRTFSVKPDKNSKRQVTINYVDPTTGESVGKQTLKGTQGQTLKVKYKLPKDYGFTSNNLQIFSAMPNGTYTFAQKNFPITINVARTIPPREDKAQNNSTIRIHYIDTKTGKEIGTSINKDIAGTERRLAFKYPVSCLDGNYTNLVYRYDGAHLLKWNSPELKAAKKDPNSVFSATSNAPFIKGVHDFYVGYNDHQQNAVVHTGSPVDPKANMADTYIDSNVIDEDANIGKPKETADKSANDNQDKKDEQAKPIEPVKINNQDDKQENNDQTNGNDQADDTNQANDQAGDKQDDDQQTDADNDKQDKGDNDAKPDLATSDEKSDKDNGEGGQKRGQALAKNGKTNKTSDKAAKPALMPAKKAIAQAGNTMRRLPQTSEGRGILGAVTGTLFVLLGVLINSFSKGKLFKNKIKHSK